MPDDIRELWRFAPVIAIMFLVAWAGHKGYWYWGHGVREVIKELQKERDDWHKLAVALLKQQGIELDDPRD